MYLQYYDNMVNLVSEQRRQYFCLSTIFCRTIHRPAKKNVSLTPYMYTYKYLYFYIHIVNTYVCNIYIFFYFFLYRSDRHKKMASLTRWYLEYHLFVFFFLFCFFIHTKVLLTVECCHRVGNCLFQLCQFGVPYSDVPEQLRVWCCLCRST